MNINYPLFGQIWRERERAMENEKQHSQQMNALILYRLETQHIMCNYFRFERLLFVDACSRLRTHMHHRGVVCCRASGKILHFNRTIQQFPKKYSINDMLTMFHSANVITTTTMTITTTTTATNSSLILFFCSVLFFAKDFRSRFPTAQFLFFFTRKTIKHCNSISHRSSSTLFASSRCSGDLFFSLAPSFCFFSLRYIKKTIQM